MSSSRKHVTSSENYCVCVLLNRELLQSTWENSFAQCRLHQAVYGRKESVCVGRNSTGKCFLLISQMSRNVQKGAARKHVWSPSKETSTCFINDWVVLPMTHEAQTVRCRGTFCSLFFFLGGGGGGTALRCLQSSFFKRNETVFKAGPPWGYFGHLWS